MTAAAGCADHGPNEDGGAETDSDPGTSDVDPPEYELDVQPILNANCLCHMQGAQSMTMEAPYMTLNPGRSYDQIVGVAAEQLASMSRVEPGQPEDSYLWHKIVGTAGSVGGEEASRMPPTAPLSAGDQQIIEDWILAGALP